MDKFDKKKELKRLLDKGLGQWTNDKIALGWPRYRCTEREFCREWKFTASTFNGWFTGNSIPEKLENIIQLAACPYFGIEVFGIIGMMPTDQLEPELRELIAQWPRIPNDKKKEFLAFWKETVLQSIIDENARSTSA